MDISTITSLPQGFELTADHRDDRNIPLEFEKIFARQMVQEMTKGLFENDDNKPLAGAGQGLYREHVVDTLSQELAEQQQLGIGDMIKRYLAERNSV